MIIVIVVTAVILSIYSAWHFYKSNCCPSCKAYQPVVYVHPKFGMHQDDKYTCMSCHHSWREPFHGPY